LTSGAQKHKREEAEKRGRRAETLAVWYLRLKGYRILSRRYRTPVGEVDLIARRGSLLAFIEVKARTSHSEAAHSISRRQQQRIGRAAEHFLAAHSALQDHDIRFDAILVAPRSWPHHLKGAWHL